MRKLKRISLVPGVQVLDAMAQKQLRGAGDVDPNLCHSHPTRESCVGSCVNYQGVPGHCAWVGVESCCKCATVG